MESNAFKNLEITNPFGSTKLNNAFSYYAEDNWDFLCKVNTGEIPMFSQAYSVLANTMEQFYKGVYMELKKINPDIENVEECEMKRHQFSKFIRKINRVMPVSSSKEGYFKILENAERIHSGYTDSKYNAYYDLNDFQRDFKRYEVQRERLYKALNVERQKYEDQEVMTAEEHIEDDDIKYYM